MQVLWIVLSFFMGAIPCGLLIAKKNCQVDPRNAGSNNVGSTNVARLCGKKWGIITLICDILKGAIPVALASTIDDGTLFITLTALAAVLGHAFSPFLDFKGGKAVATTIGVFIAIAFWPLLCAVIVCLALITYSGFVSLGSLALVISLPVFLLIGDYANMVPLALCIMVLVVWAHRYNIQRLVCGIEKPWNKKAYKE